LISVGESDEEAQRGTRPPALSSFPEAILSFLFNGDRSSHREVNGSLSFFSGTCAIGVF
jgi:hypothetical protein